MEGRASTLARRNAATRTVSDAPLDELVERREGDAGGGLGMTP
jgi:hypothetical protein